MAEDKKYTHIGLLWRTKRMIAILASLANGGEGINIYELVNGWAQHAWDEAKAAGLVQDDMLPVAAHWVGVDVGSGDDRTVQAVVDAGGKIVSAETPKKRVQMIGRGK